MFKQATFMASNRFVVVNILHNTAESTATHVATCKYMHKAILSDRGSGSVVDNAVFVQCHI